MADGRTGWNEMAADYDRTREIPDGGEARVTAAVARRLAGFGDGLVLDLGCGTGRFSVPLHRAGIRVVGADRSAEMLGVLSAKRAGGGPPIVRCDALALPFRRAFDAVLFSHFLHLLPSVEALAPGLAAVLRPGAHVVVVDTSIGPRPASYRVLSEVMPALGAPWSPWPTVTDSRDRRLFVRLVAALGAAALPPEPVGSFAATATLREHLDAVRARRWWTFRTHDAAAVARAADAAEQRLRDEGADLDAPVNEPVVVDLLAARLG